MKTNYLSKLTILLVVFFSSWNTCNALDAPTFVWPYAGVYIAPGTQAAEFRACPNERNVTIAFSFYIKNTSTGAETPFGVRFKEAPKKFGHYSVNIDIPSCPPGSQIICRIRNLKGINFSGDNMQVNYTTAIEKHDGTPSGIQLACGDLPWPGIQPITLNFSVDNPAGTTLGVYNGLTNWYHAASPMTMVAQTNNGQAFSPAMTVNPNLQGMYNFQVPSNCLPNLYGQAIFLRIPNPAQSGVQFFSFLLDPQDLVCSSQIACNLKDVTYYELPTLFTLAGALPGVGVTDIKWYYQHPNSTEVLNGKSSPAGSYSFGSVTHVRRKVCFSHLLDGTEPTTNTYRGELSYATTIINPISGNTEKITCTTSIYATVMPAISNSDISSSGQTVLTNFQTLYDQLDLLPGVDPCNLIGIIKELPISGLAQGGGDEAYDICNLPETIPQGYIEESLLESTGISLSTVTYGWYKNANRLVNQNIRQSINDLGIGQYTKMLEVNNIPIREFQEIVILDCMLPMEFPIEAAAIKKYKNEMKDLGYDVQVLLPNSEEDSYVKTAILTPTPSKDVDGNIVSMNIYPNPSTGIFSVLLNDEEDQISVITIRDASGRLIEQHLISDEIRSETINISFNLASGLYIIEAFGEETRIQQRLIVE